MMFVPDSLGDSNDLMQDHCCFREAADTGSLYQPTIPDCGQKWPRQDGCRRGTQDCLTEEEELGGEP